MDEDPPVEWWKQGAVEGAPEPIMISPPKINPFQDVEFSPRPEHTMSFMDSIDNVIRNFLNFSDRASRSEYWWFQLFFFANLAFFGTVFGEVLSDGYDFLASVLFFGPLLVPSLAVTFRRLHDLGYPGWISLGVFIPYLNFWFVFVLVALLAYEGEGKPNKYGEVPTNVRIMALPKTD